MHRKIEHRRWTVRAVTPEQAMDAMEAEMQRLGHRVITHELTIPSGAGRWLVESLIEVRR